MSEKLHVSNEVRATIATAKGTLLIHQLEAQKATAEYNHLIVSSLLELGVGVETHSICLDCGLVYKSAKHQACPDCSKKE